MFSYNLKISFLIQNIESLMSITIIMISVWPNSSRVDLNASIMYAGNLLIKPTVSEIKMVLD